MKEPWSIKTRSRECSGSEKTFEDGETIHAALFPDPESSGYIRKDFCEEAWNARSDDAAVPFSHWKTTYEAPVTEEKAEDVVQEDPESLLHRLVEEEEEHTENARYILAVMLERQKLLRETDTQQLPSGILRVYEHRKTGDVFIIKDPQIALADVEKVQDEIRELLDPQPEPEPEPEELEEAAEENIKEPETPAQENLEVEENSETPKIESSKDDQETEARPAVSEEEE